MDDSLYAAWPVLAAAAMMVLASITALLVAMDWTAQQREARRRAGQDARYRTSVEPGSPLHLSEYGEKISNRIGGLEWAQHTAPGLKDRLDDLRPFRIDEFSSRYVDNELDEATQERVAECAYEFGTERHAVHEVLRVLLRNELLRLTGQQVPEGKTAKRDDGTE